MLKQCLNHLLSSKIGYAAREGDYLVNTEDTVVNILQGPFKSELEKYGMRVITESAILRKKARAVSINILQISKHRPSNILVKTKIKKLASYLRI